MDKTMLLKRFLIGLVAMCSIAGAAAPGFAQYLPIPNYSGIGAGKLFREAINARFSGLLPSSPLITSVPFSQMPGERDGLILWCSDCMRTTPCSGGGAGAWAFGSRSAWSCSNGPLETNLDANHNRLINLGANIAAGDALSQAQSHLNDLATATGDYNMGGFLVQNLGQPATIGDILAWGKNASVANLTVTGTLNNATPGVVAGTNVTVSGTWPDQTISATGGTATGVFDVTAYGAKCDGTTDDTAAFNSAIAAANTAGGGVVELPAKTCDVSQLSFGGHSNIVVQGQSSYGSTLKITGAGGGACALGSNGGVVMGGSATEYDDGIRHLSIVAANSSLDCLVNASSLNNTTAGNINFFLDDVNLWTTGLSAASTNPIALYLGNDYPFHYRVGKIQGDFRQQIVNAGAALNNAIFADLQVFGNSYSYPSVTNNRLYMASMGDTQTVTFLDDDFEGGPNMIDCGGGGSNTGEACNVIGSWLGDTLTPGADWLSGAAYSAGAIVWPSYSTTGSISSTSASLTMASASNLYVGIQVAVMGAGASGANLFAKVTAISGTTVTLGTAAGTTVSGANVFWSDYSGHVYLATTGGTSGTTQPTWPTADGATVTDGTVTWMEYKHGALLVEDGYNGTVSGSNLGSNPVGVYVDGGPTSGAAVEEINGNTMWTAGAFDIYSNQATVHVTGNSWFQSGSNAEAAVGIVGAATYGSNSVSANYTCCSMPAQIYLADTNSKGIADSAPVNLAGNGNWIAYGGNYLQLGASGQNTPNAIRIGSLGAISGFTALGTNNGTSVNGVQAWNLLISDYNHSNQLALDDAGDLGISGSLHAASIVNGCAGTATLSSGSATVSNSCISGSRPIICTDNTSTSAAACSAVPSSGSVALHGTSTDTVSWAQL
jgi:Pectate lyase superfamily protein